MRDLDELFKQLATSNFRRRFTLKGKELAYLRAKGLAVVVAHAREFIAQRLAPAEPENDGKQTPWRNHPVFVAQHATATCCRGCLAKWHRIEAHRALGDDEQRYIAVVLAHWLSPYANEAAEGTRQLF